MSSWIERAVPFYAVMLLAASLTPGGASPAAEGPGRAAMPEEIAAQNLDVRGDGAGLPEGSGSVAQGEALYAERCAACHGEFGEGAGRMPALIGGEDSLTTDRPRRTVGSFWPHAPTVFDYVRRAMPFGHAATLSADETYALTAFILNANGIVEDDFIADRRTLPAVKMPNRDGFVPDDRPWKPAARCMSDCRTPPRIVSRARKEEGK